MISAWWLLLLFPVSLFMFFLGVAMCRNSIDDFIDDEIREGK